MKPLLKTLIIILLSSFFSCNCSDSKKTNNPGFIIHRGVNASHWLSQSEKRGEDRKNYMLEADFKNIADMGFDHVRIPFDEEQMWDEDGNKNPEVFELLHNGVKWSMDNGLRVIIDLHILRSHHFNYDSKKLWTDTVAQQKFWRFWNELSDEFGKYSTDSLAYELMNEAVADNPEDWNKLITKGIATIRKKEALRIIVLGSNKWQQIYTFPQLKIPENDSNIILSFHFYEPFIITHYKTWWNPMKDYDGPVNYPGQTIDTMEYSNYSGKTLSTLKDHNNFYSEKVFEEKFKIAADIAEKYNLPLYCGEFGCYPSTDINIRKAVYKDLITAFDKYNIAWAHWNYKNDFPLVDSVSLEPYHEIVDILMK